MKLRSILAASAALGMTIGGLPVIKMSPNGNVEFSIGSAAYAKGKKGQRIWMPAASREEIVATFLRGDEPCVGSMRNHTCYNYDPVMQTLNIQHVSRPEGWTKNVVVNTTVVLDGNSVVVRDEVGKPLLVFQSASESTNATSTWGSALANILPAAFNGVGAAGVQAAFSPCGGNKCGGGTPVVNVVNATAAAGASSNSAASSAYTGGAGTCSTCTAPSTHTQDGPGSAPAGN